MADYFPLLVRAISGLPQNTGDARKAVYDRARAALLKQLRGVEPPLPEGEILRQRQALEEAIRRVEAEQTPDAPVEAPSEVAPAEEVPAETPTAAPLPKPTLPQAPQPQSTAPEAKSSEPAPDAASSSSDTSDLEEEDPTQTRPRLGPAKVGERHERPRLPADRDDAKRPRWQRTVIAVALLGLLIGGGAYAVVKRDDLFGTASKPAAQQTPAQPQADAPKAEQPKNSDRVTQAGGAPAQRQAPAAPRQGATAQRAYLFEESTGGAQGLQTYEGTVTWRTETYSAGPGLPPDVGIRADVQIPGRLGAVFTLRRNADAALPASHTLEVSFSLPQDFAYGGITNVPGIRMKQTESAQGAPLAGLSVRVNPTYYLVGLSAVSSDKDRNLQLLQSRPWIDIPLVYTNNKRAILAFEKGPAGTQAFQDAFSAWGELLPPAPPPMALPPAGAN